MLVNQSSGFEFTDIESTMIVGSEGGGSVGGGGGVSVGGGGGGQNFPPGQIKSMASYPPKTGGDGDGDIFDISV